jgi:hypothetical protein
MKNKEIREIKILEEMISIYCSGMKHSVPCADCEELLSYAMKRSELCPYKDTKTFCSVCKTHCYDSDHRNTIRQVMRYSSRRYFLKHPIMTLQHGIVMLKHKIQK